MARVSVVMGVYNSNDISVLKEAIESILNQTFKDFEFIICDDGSTNNTIDMIKEVVKQDKRVRILKNEKNMGLAYTLNKCLKEAKGEYIARMDADDKCALNRFEEQVKILDNNQEIQVVNINSYLFDENGIWGKLKYNEIITPKDFLYNNPIVHPAVMVRKSAYDLVGGYRDIKNTVRVEDYDLFLRMCIKELKIVTIQDFLFFFRDDKQAKKRRKFRYRINEMKIRYYGFKRLGLLKNIFNYIYVVKPLIANFLTNNTYRKIKSWRSKQ